MSLAACAALYAANKSLALPGLFFTGYFSDILAGWLLCALVWLLWPKVRYMGCAMALCFAAGIFWELITPLYLQRSVSDPWDMAAYLTGGIIWWGICKIKIRT